MGKWIKVAYCCHGNQINGTRGPNNGPRAFFSLGHICHSAFTLTGCSADYFFVLPSPFKNGQAAKNGCTLDGSQLLFQSIEWLIQGLVLKVMTVLARNSFGYSGTKQKAAKCFFFPLQSWLKWCYEMVNGLILSRMSHWLLSLCTEWTKGMLFRPIVYMHDNKAWLNSMFELSFFFFFCGRTCFYTHKPWDYLLQPHHNSI